jgi:hypothetical protein
MGNDSTSGQNPDYQIWLASDTLTLFDAIRFLLGVWLDRKAYDDGHWGRIMRQEFDAVHSLAVGSVHAGKLNARKDGNDFWVNPREFVWWAEDKRYPIPSEMAGHKCMTDHIGEVYSAAPLVELDSGQMEHWAGVDSWTFGEAIFVMHGYEPPDETVIVDELHIHFFEAYDHFVRGAEVNRIGRERYRAGKRDFIDTPNRWVEWGVEKGFPIIGLLRERFLQESRQTEPQEEKAFPANSTMISEDGTDCCSVRPVPPTRPSTPWDYPDIGPGTQPAFPETPQRNVGTGRSDEKGVGDEQFSPAPDLTPGQPKSCPQSVTEPSGQRTTALSRLIDQIDEKLTRDFHPPSTKQILAALHDEVGKGVIQEVTGEKIYWLTDSRTESTLVLRSLPSKIAKRRATRRFQPPA